MGTKFKDIPPLTDEEEARIQRQIAGDPDAPEATDEQIAQARTFAEVFPDLAESIKRSRGRPKAETGCSTSQSGSIRRWWQSSRPPAKAGKAVSTKFSRRQRSDVYGIRAAVGAESRRRRRRATCPPRSRDGRRDPGRAAGQSTVIRPGPALPKLSRIRRDPRRNRASRPKGWSADAAARRAPAR
jgi:hypothetical protein